MFWPALSVAIPQTAVLVKYVRTAMLEQLREDYVRTARGKGVGETAILYVHVFKNAIVAVVPLIGMIIASVLSGSIIIEQVYGIPGIGKLLISSVTSRDFPLTQTLVVYIAVIIVVINFLVDIVIQIIDPRIRLADRG
jgi:peptide/nickel transport system permease protein